MRGQQNYAGSLLLYPIEEMEGVFSGSSASHVTVILLYTDVSLILRQPRPWMTCYKLL